MSIHDFLAQVQDEVRAGDYPWRELMFAEIVMQHMAEAGMTFEPTVCHYDARVGNANLRLSGYAISDESDQLDLFVSLYDDTNELVPVPDSETKKAAERCLRFLAKCADGRLSATMDESSDAYGLVITIQDCYDSLDQVRIYVLTTGVCTSRNFRPREIGGKIVKLEVMDIERLYRHCSEGRPRDELVVNFDEISGGALPCVYVGGGIEQYDYALTAIPGETMRFLYEKYGERLLEANVRSFLAATGRVNRGIRDTLRDSPQLFMAYNNGIVIVADELSLKQTPGGGPAILWMRGLQVVNGGQTVASLYFAKRRAPNTDLGLVRIPAKVIILKSGNAVEEEKLVANISKFANSQNSVPQSDLSANRPFHLAIEKLATSTCCPDGVGRWFYERARGSYRTMLARQGSTPAALRSLRQSIPSGRKIAKTDLAKYCNSWNQAPHIVSLGAQKNFIRFMASLDEREKGSSSRLLPDTSEFKRLIAQAILFRSSQKLIRPMFSAFQANVTTYTVALIANRLGDRLNFEVIWRNQDVSSQLQRQIRKWALEVNDVLHETANGRMISEWAKREECWIAVYKATYSDQLSDIPEVS